MILARYDVIPLEPTSNASSIWNRQAIDDPAAGKFRDEVGQPRQPFALITQLDVKKLQRSTSQRSALNLQVGNLRHDILYNSVIRGRGRAHNRNVGRQQ